MACEAAPASILPVRHRLCQDGMVSRREAVSLVLLALAGTRAATGPSSSCLSRYTPDGQLLELIELNFTGAQTIYSNLGGQGGKPGLQPPDPAKQNIRLGPLGRMLDGTVIELLIENQTQCECSALMA